MCETQALGIQLCQQIIHVLNASPTGRAGTRKTSVALCNTLSSETSERVQVDTKEKPKCWVEGVRQADIGDTANGRWVAPPCLSSKGKHSIRFSQEMQYRFHRPTKVPLPLRYANSAKSWMRVYLERSC